MTDPKVLFGLHITKCAGTSILKAAQSQLPASQIYQATALIENFWQNSNEFYEITNHQGIRFFFGHHVYDEMVKLFNDVYLFTFLRDPIDRHVSNFKFLNRLRSDLSLPAMSVEEYIGRENSMYSEYSMCGFILSRFSGFVDPAAETAAEKAISALSKFDYVGDLATLSGFSDVMAEYLGLEFSGITKENVSLADENINDEVLDELVESLNAADDIELYRAFKSSPGGLRNPFQTRQAVEWRSTVFAAGEYDYGKLEDRLVNSLYWEYRDHGVLDQFLDLIPQKLSFLNKFVEKATPQPEVVDDQDGTAPIEIDTPLDTQDGWLKRIARAVKNLG